MAYFDHDNKTDQRHQRVFHEPVNTDLDDALETGDAYDEDLDLYEDDEFLDDELMTDEERALARRDRWRVLAGVGDFLAVIAGTVVILLLVALLVSLINWVHADISQSFTLWQTKL